jgi:hypothetical protein
VGRVLYQRRCSSRFAPAAGVVFGVAGLVLAAIAEPVVAASASNHAATRPGMPFHPGSASQHDPVSGSDTSHER